jgi:hypothetical protein
MWNRPAAHSVVDDHRHAFEEPDMHPLITTFVANQIIDDRVTRASRERRFSLRRTRRAARRAGASARPIGRAAPRTM